MRALLVLLALAALVAAALLYFGLIQIEQTRSGSVQVQAPKFEADVGRVGVGTENRTVTVPTLEVERPANAQ
ncbi:hypothetical protein [Sphingomonas sp.]|jgi:hypothetical protein|uniref:hypothetical protein n=1 Tax=Sphingomonas sp. TaxID=28214 RepID=UPI002D7FD91C|nr:hypothetical protein [Sphingomonas sp.]HEU0043081.1 hypothetical protein [Sphingomonas sp.]